MKNVTGIKNSPLKFLPNSYKSSLEEFTRAVKGLFTKRFHSMVLYGSYARGDALPDSDLDILVVLDSSKDLNLDWDQCIDLAAEIASRTGVLISVLVCLSNDYIERMHPLLINIRSEGIIVE